MTREELIVSKRLSAELANDAVTIVENLPQLLLKIEGFHRIQHGPYDGTLKLKARNVAEVMNAVTMLEPLAVRRVKRDGVAPSFRAEERHREEGDEVAPFWLLVTTEPMLTTQVLWFAKIKNALIRVEVNVDVLDLVSYKTTKGKQELSRKLNGASIDPFAGNRKGYSNFFLWWDEFQEIESIFGSIEKDFCHVTYFG